LRGPNIAQSEQQIADVFNRKWRENYISDAPFFSEPGRFAGDCLEFIKGKKYRGNPNKVLYWLKCGVPGNTHMYA
jgi:hypothetical protein